MVQIAFTLRIGPQERNALKHLSKIERRPINQLLNEAIRNYLREKGERERGLEASLAELNAAVAAILNCAGLSPKESPPGEADPRVTPGDPASPPTAEASPAPSADVTRGSAPSMAPSPPAAATATA